MSTVIQDSRTAIKTRVDAAGITCFAYEDFDPNAQTPLATLTLDTGTLGEFYDQQFGLRRVVFLLRVYQLVQNNAQQDLAYQDANIHAIITALGADPTLGGKVTNCEALGFDNGFISANGQRYALCEFTVEVTPFGNTA